MKPTLSCFLLLCLLSACQPPKPAIDYSKLSDDEKRKPENALAGLKAPDDLEVTLFAAEPMLTNPTNMDIDARGRVWICEGYNYRNAHNPANAYQPKGDRILIMEDTNGDGKADASKVFYQGEDINAALGIAVLGNKVIVSCSPNVFVFTDENGDDVADKKEILFSRLQGEQTDHAMHAFSFGPDGRLYFNFGNNVDTLRDKNGNVLKDDLGRPLTDHGTPYRQGMVARCRLDGSQTEILGHNFRNNYEVAVDAYGTLWQSDNDDDGNKAVRINYVMEYGSYGYTDEMTGAGWSARRTNLEAEIPKRHWHQNDPGTIPNLLYTGAGSPTGIMVYEGSLLPERFRNQIIHSDAGPNIVRAYPVKNDGAGYSATIDNILDGSNGDNWFRPADVCTAPDGSLFVADWYDPSVGGHYMADASRGRIYRISPKGNTSYKVPESRFDTPQHCVEALKNPNLAVRYLAWTTLHDMQATAEPALLTLWKSDDSRLRARALWLLGQIQGQGDKYVSEAISDKDENLRITGIRLARLLHINTIPYLQKLVKDPSPQVRREVAIALHHNTAPEAATLWATLAMQHDGKDRWYLEALGIGADNQWDTFFDKWLAQAGDNWKTPGGKDIIWRSRAKGGIARLASLIPESQGNERLRYFRAFDFQQDASKTDALLGLLGNTTSPDVAVLTLKHLEPESAKKSAKFQALLPGILAQVKGTADYLDIVQRYGLTDQQTQLFNMAMAMPDSSLGREAAGIFLKNGGTPLFLKAAANPDPVLAMRAIHVFGKVGSSQAKDALLTLVTDPSRDFEIRKYAIKHFSDWEGEPRLLALVKAKKLPKDLEPAAAAVFAVAWRPEIRNEAAKFLKVEAPDGKPLPPLPELLKMKGTPAEGEKVFATYCYTCHQVNGKGNNFGPGLSEIGSKLAKQGLYNAILYPDAGISFGYEGYVIKLKDGSEIQGIVTSKTETDLQVKLPGGMLQKTKISEVVSQTEMAGSMMPRFPLGEADLVNLVEYLATLKKK